MAIEKFHKKTNRWGLNMSCDRFEENMKHCNCTYAGCSRKGRCCECLHYHRRMGQLPACYFDSKAEQTYDRSIEHFVRLNSK